MKKLRFAKDNGTEFYWDLIDALNAYFSEKKIGRYGNGRMMFKIALYFTMDAVFYGLMITSTSAGLFLLFYMLMGLSILLTAFNISHDAAHGVAVRSRFWNRVLFQLSFNLQGNNAYVWGKNHTESHHLYTNIEGSDIDVLNNPMLRMTDTQPLRWYHRFQHLYSPVLYLFYSLNWSFFREVLLIFRVSSRTIDIRMPAREVVLLILFKILYIVYMIVVPVMVMDFSWMLVVLAFLLNHFMISLIFVGVLGVSHLSDYVAHPVPDDDGRLDVSWPKLQLITSVDYHPGSRFFNWTLGGFNAHALHHLLPNICHIHYLEVLPIFRRLCRQHGITYMELSYWESLKSHFRFLKAMGSQQTIKPLAYEG